MTTLLTLFRMILMLILAYQVYSWERFKSKAETKIDKLYYGRR